MLSYDLVGRLPRPLRRLVSPPHRAFYAALDRWRGESSDSRLYDHEGLGPESVVLDIGGYRGDWSARIVDRYAPTVHVIEPHPGFARGIAERFANNPKIHVHCFGLAPADGSFLLAESGPGSSEFRPRGRLIRCEKRETATFLRDQGIARIDLMKINIEGGEYDLLPSLISSQVMDRVGKLLVQFHLIDGTSPRKRDEVRASLHKTHAESWCYPFVWEAWSAR